VMQMRPCQVGMNGPLVDGLQAQVENLGEAVTDPDDAWLCTVMLCLFVNERIEIRSV
jgi:hypothetical protein